jgi:hypothetical protein
MDKNREAPLPKVTTGAAMPTKVIDKSGEVRTRTRDLRCDSPDALGAATYAGDCIRRRLQRDLTQLIDGSPNEPLGAQKGITGYQRRFPIRISSVTIPKT